MCLVPGFWNQVSIFCVPFQLLPYSASSTPSPKTHLRETASAPVPIENNIIPARLVFLFGSRHFLQPTVETSGFVVFVFYCYSNGN